MRIASVPSAHPYVTSVLGGETVLPDPTPPGQTPGDGVWWPPVVVGPDWVRAHGGDADVVHGHFGFEHFTPAQLTAWLDALDAAGIPYVHTVHDLQNPHLADQTRHLATLDVLLPRAGALLTLTDEAADAVSARWGRRPVVVPHPQVVPDEWFARSDALRAAARAATDGAGGAATAESRGTSPRVGVHLGAVRASTDPTPWLSGLGAACAHLGASLVVRAQDTALAATAGHAREVLDVVGALAGTGALTLEHGPRLPDDDLYAWVAGLDVAVLPYRAGTHSGWLEMCWDLGTSVLLPPVGAIADQHDDDRFRRVFTDASQVEPALAALLAARADDIPWGDATRRRAERAVQLEQVRAAHREVYEGLLAR